LLTNQLVIERAFEYNGGMELGDSTSTAMDAALDALNEALTDLITAVESGGLDHLNSAEKVAVWQRFETIRNQLPLVDHRLIAHAESNDLPGEYCCSTLSQFLVRVLQLSHGEAASRVRAAAGHIHPDELGGDLREQKRAADSRHDLRRPLAGEGEHLREVDVAGDYQPHVGWKQVARRRLEGGV
jgi:hypothetical protein